MKNPFDRQIADTLRNELGNIKASDDLIARTLARVNSEKAEIEEDPTRVTHLSALNMGYIRQQEKDRERHNRKITRIVLAGLSIAAACCVTINLLTFFRDKTGNVSTAATSQAELTAAGAFTDSREASVISEGVYASTVSVDYSEYIYVSDASVSRNIYLPGNINDPADDVRPDNMRNNRQPSGNRAF